MILSNLADQIRRLEELLQADVHLLASVKDTTDGANVEGVYAISHPNNADDILYVGTTRSKKVWGRLNDHRTNNGNSDLAVMLTKHDDLPQVCASYGVRWIALPDKIQRGSFEHFAIGVLKPRLNK